MKRLPALLALLTEGCGPASPSASASADSAPEHAIQSAGPGEAEKTTPAEPEGELALSVDGVALTVQWEDNAAVDALKAQLREGGVTVETRRYGGFEQVGGLPWSLPGSDSSITTTAGDIALYTGNSIVLFYGSNTWTYTRLGRIEGLSEAELETLLSGEDAQVSLSLSSG